MEAYFILFLLCSQELLTATRKMGHDTMATQRATELMGLIPRAGDNMMLTLQLKGYDVSY
jgi:hypothetical protein